MKNSIIELLEQHLTVNSNKKVFTFIKHNKNIIEELTYQELTNQSKMVASLLQQYNVKGERALIILPQELGYITALLGCFYAGIIAVTAYPPKRNKEDHRLKAIFENCTPKTIIGTRAIHQYCKKKNPTLLKCQWIFMDELDISSTVNNYQPQNLTSTDIALLQYTSGSTGNPKGVMVSHGNLMICSKMMAVGMNYNEQSRLLSWLPFFHDMGLIKGIILPIYVNCPAVLFSPQGFAQKPSRWLKAITKYKITHTGGPNFSLDSCNQITAEADLKDIQLDSLKYMLSGSEPVRKETMETFVHKFSKYGLNPKALSVGYGMAEATLMITCTSMSEMFKSISIQKAIPYNGEYTNTIGFEEKDVINCGRTCCNHQLRVVSPVTFKPCKPMEVGEVWFKGPTITQGYWQNKAATNKVYNYTLEGETGYFRTGDLGFMMDDELYITGRIKDIVIIRGQNFYPDDIEYHCSQAHRGLTQNGTIAFSRTLGNREQLVVVQELKRTFIRMTNTKTLIEKIRQKITSMFEVEPSIIVLVSPKSLPKTSSGKVMRSKCKDLFIKGKLRVVDEWKKTFPQNLVLSKEDKDFNTQESVENLLKQIISTQLDKNIDSINGDESVFDMGLDSLAIVDTIVEMEKNLSIELGTTVFSEFQTINNLSNYVFNTKLKGQLV